MKVEFHSGVPDKIGHACRFLRKAQAAGARVVVGGDTALLDRLDTALWTFDAHSFVAHARLKRGAQPSAALAARTPTWLADEPRRAPPAAVLVNLGPAMQDDAQGFERVIEIVGADADDRSAGRERWRLWGQVAGVERVHHDFSAQA